MFMRSIDVSFSFHAINVFVWFDVIEYWPHRTPHLLFNFL